MYLGTKEIGLRNETANGACRVSDSVYLSITHSLTLTHLYLETQCRDSITNSLKQPTTARSQNSFRHSAVRLRDHTHWAGSPGERAQYHAHWVGSPGERAQDHAHWVGSPGERAQDDAHWVGSPGERAQYHAHWVGSPARRESSRRRTLGRQSRSRGAEGEREQTQ